ncbi:hypothetical protein CFP56_023592 [Quercus suber]|uniref:Uncharacterized protein n=1 Tax=Quercus suber TaxID=58331 RepID=A0AAW0K915_QUESU
MSETHFITHLLTIFFPGNF